jgi:hypothetical protein
MHTITLRLTTRVPLRHAMFLVRLIAECFENAGIEADIELVTTGKHATH